ncbi:ATP-binding protein [Paenibacillus sp. PL2-23]|uniref:ATP-binding protein n=1 Tax=Paenibacillus sp. PL2-23 TaxID=2100729 RepID=UPI0030F50BA5
MDKGPELRRRWIITSELGQEKRLVRDIEQALLNEQVPLPRLEEMKTAIAEACLNAIEHGNRLNKALNVTVAMLVQASGLTFQVCDQGEGFDIGSVKGGLSVRDKIDWEQPRGWGLPFMRQFADRVTASKTAGMFCVELQFGRTEQEGVEQG